MLLNENFRQFLLQSEIFHDDHRGLNNSWLRAVYRCLYNVRFQGNRTFWLLSWSQPSNQRHLLMKNVIEPPDENINILFSGASCRTEVIIT